MLSCWTCEAGNYSPAPGECDPCPLGSYNFLLNQTSCTPAPAGGYVDAVGAQAYSQCPAGTANPLTGQTSASACVSCATGYYATGTGNAACINVPYGYNSAGTTLGGYVGAGGASSYTACPARLYNGVSTPTTVDPRTLPSTSSLECVRVPWCSVTGTAPQNGPTGRMILQKTSGTATYLSGGNVYSSVSTPPAPAVQTPNVQLAGYTFVINSVASTNAVSVNVYNGDPIPANLDQSRSGNYRLTNCGTFRWASGSAYYVNTSGTATKNVNTNTSTIYGYTSVTDGINQAGQFAFGLVA